MAKFAVFKNAFLIGCIATVFSAVNCQTVADEKSTTLPQLDVNESLFTAPEVNILQTAEAVDISPLTLARRLHHAWLLGRKEAMIDLAKNATSPGLGLDISRLIDLNNRMEFTITPQQMEDELAKAYQLGGLTVLNHAVEMSHKTIPEIRVASPEEVRMMRMKERESLRKMFRTERMKQQMLRGEHIRHRMRNPLQMKSAADSEDLSMKHSVKLSPVEYSSNLPMEYSPIERSSIKSSPYDSALEYEEEEIIDVTELDDISDSEFAINQEYDEEHRHKRCPHRVNCRICRRRRYRRCRRCRRIRRRCEREEDDDDRSSRF